MGDGSNQVYLHTPDGTKLYVSRSAAVRSYYLQQELQKADTPTSAVSEIMVPVEGPALVTVMEHCERHADAFGSSEPQQADHDGVDAVEVDALLSLAGVVHRLNVEPLLSLVLRRTAALLGSNAWGAERFRPTGAVSDGPSAVLAAAASDEFLFTSEPAAEPVWGSPWGWGGKAGEAIDAAADCWVAQALGSERAISACCEHLDAATLRRLKDLSPVWCARARRTLCSEAWRERQRALESFDLGQTRHLSDVQRCAAAGFVLSLPRLKTLRVDGLEASLVGLLRAESIDGRALIGALTPPTLAQSLIIVPALTADGLAAQNEFLGLVVLWTLQQSRVLRSADLEALHYSGLLPLIALVPSAVVAAARASLTSLTLWRCPLPVRELCGLSAPPASEISLRWKQLGQLDALTIAECVSMNGSVARLDLSWNALGPAAAGRLAHAIARSTSLHDVALDETSLGDEFAPSMAKALAQNSTLTRLSLCYCGLGEVGKRLLKEAVVNRSQPLELRL